MVCILATVVVDVDTDRILAFAEGKGFLAVGRRLGRLVGMEQPGSAVEVGRLGVEVAGTVAEVAAWWW